MPSPFTPFLSLSSPKVAKFRINALERLNMHPFYNHTALEGMPRTKSLEIHQVDLRCGNDAFFGLGRKFARSSTTSIIQGYIYFVNRENNSQLPTKDMREDN